MADAGDCVPAATAGTVVVDDGVATGFVEVTDVPFAGPAEGLELHPARRSARAATTTRPAVTRCRMPHLVPSRPRSLVAS
jgi:hypothetical protein